MKTLSCSVAMTTLLLFSSCGKEEITTERLLQIDYNGDVTKIEQLGEYSKYDAIQFLGISNPDYPIKTTCGFTLYRISYKTKNFDGNEIIVSGLLALPDSKNIKGIVSWQHGTNTFRPNSISKPSQDEGIGISALFAANDYILLAPDYIGLGVSTHVHPYYHMNSTANTIIDFIKIGEKVLIEFTNGQNHNLFLAGFSQGGGATVATQRMMETNNPTQLKIKGAASIAGAFNLRNISIPHTLTRNHMNSIIYLGYLSNAYSLIYNVPLSDFIQEPYASQLSTFFDGTRDNLFMSRNLPTRPDEFFTAQFYNELLNENLNWFAQALDENEMYQWKPINELRLYYGENDEDVIPQEAISAFNYMNSMSGNVKLYNLGQHDHETVILQALPQIQWWFNSVQ